MVLAMDDTASKRRRGLGVVTPNACTECRKKRSKCDGHNPCGRCVSQKNTHCVYELPVRQSKENMRHEIEQLREQQHQTDRLLAALVSKDKSDEVLEKLRTGETIDAVLEKLDITEETTIKGKEVAKGRITAQNVTAYARKSSTTAIENALRGTRIIGNTSIPTSAAGSAHGDVSLHPSSITDLSGWPTWGGGDEGGSSQQPSTFVQDDAMQWSPESADRDARNAEPPLVGKWYLQAEGTQDEITEQMRFQGRETILGESFGTQDPSLSQPGADSWTTITSDNALVEHLLALYFCWEYPTFASLSKEHFLEDFRFGRRRNCSSLLVNSMLAVGCRFSTQGVTRTDPDNSNTSGDHFFAEAVKLLNEQEDKYRVTTVQALGLMSIREASAGRSSMALFYSGQSIRLAIEMGLHSDDHIANGDDDNSQRTVRSATFWGAFALDQCWSLSTGRIPAFSQIAKLTPPPLIVDTIEASPWIPYTDDGDGLSGARWQQQLTGAAGAPMERNCTQPSNVRSVYKTFCELSEIVHDSLYLYYSPGSQLTAKRLLAIYGRYLNWYDAIPSALRLGHNFTPAVLFCHMYYHYAILLLFRPFIKLHIIGSGVSPRDVCVQAADAISAVVYSYDQLYTLRRTPSFVPYFVLASSITHLVAHGLNIRGPAQFHQGIADLKVMESCHGFATRTRDILQFLSSHWEIAVEWKDDEQHDPGASIDPHDIRDMRRRASKADGKTLCKPRRSSLNQFCPNLEDLLIKNHFRPMSHDASGEGDDERVDGLLRSAIFSPFPLQGRPLLGMMHEAGFQMLHDDG